MRIAKVVGNVVSTIKEKTHYGYKMMIVGYLDNNFQLSNEQEIGFDAVGAGIGDIVLTCKEGGAAKKLLGNDDIIMNVVICGIVDRYTIDGVTVKTT